MAGHSTESSRRTSAPPSNQRRTAAAMVLPLRAGVSQRGSVQCALVSVCSIHAIAQTPLPAINSWRSPSGNHAVAINCGNPWQSSSATIIDGIAPVNNKQGVHTISSVAMISGNQCKSSSVALQVTGTHQRQCKSSVAPPPSDAVRCSMLLHAIDRLIAHTEGRSDAALFPLRWLT